MQCPKCDSYNVRAETRIVKPTHAQNFEFCCDCHVTFNWVHRRVSKASSKMSLRTKYLGLEYDAARVR